MNILFYLSLFFLFISYPFSLAGLYEIASIFYILTVLSMVGAAMKEFDGKKRRKKVPYLRLVK
jgi:hypothetical protein